MSGCHLARYLQYFMNQHGYRVVLQNLRQFSIDVILTILFLLFRHKDHSVLFLDYLNHKHSNINFTMECESCDKLQFLDCLVHRNKNRFECSVFRKDSFTGQQMSYFSNCSFKFKLNCIQTLLSRAYRVCSNYLAMHNEFCFLRDYFRANGFCTLFIDRRKSKFLDKVFGCSKGVTGTCLQMISQFTSPFLTLGLFLKNSCRIY